MREAIAPSKSYMAQFGHKIPKKTRPLQIGIGDATSNSVVEPLEDLPEEEKEECSTSDPKQFMSLVERKKSIIAKQCE